MLDGYPRLLTGGVAAVQVMTMRKHRTRALVLEAKLLDTIEQLLLKDEFRRW